MGGEYTIRGTVTTPAGPAGGVVVEAVDADLGPDDSLATTTTDDDGRYELRIDPADAGGLLEGDPELYLRVSHGDRTSRVEVPAPSGRDVIEVDVELGPGGSGVETGRGVTDGAGTRSQISPTSGGTTDRRPRHGMMEHRGMANVPRDPAHPGRGRFGRMFPNLAPAEHDAGFLQRVGLPGNVLEEQPDSPAGDADTVPAGFVFLGQFIDHDITLDPISSLSKQADPDALRNFRTARLDLDSLYGAGPEAQPFLYRQDDPEKFLLGENDAGERADLPRNGEGTALIGDMRNDENLVLSQLQQAMLRFHNRVVDHLRETTGEEEVFEEAQQLVRWHYQWIVLHEYLPTVCQEPVVQDTLDDRELFTVDTGEGAYMPVEFAGAVYRFGHSQARFEYEINDEFGTGKLFGPPGDDDALSSGFEPVPSRKVVDWRHFFEFGGTEPQPAREIDPKLAPDLLELPFIGAADHEPWERSLASRNLVRGRRLGLPSGPAVARRLGEEPLSNAESGFHEALDAHGPAGEHEAPLWYYTLAEASETTGGETLGPVGSRVVAEVLAGLVDADPRSFRTIQPNWTPTLPAPVSGGGTDYRMADLLAFALDYEV